MRNSLFLLAVLTFALCTSLAIPEQAASQKNMAAEEELFSDMPGTTVHVPGPLRPWEQWVLHDKQRHFCPAQGEDPGTRVCIFPSSLQLKTRKSGASFTLEVHAYDEGRIELPHVSSATAQAWPVDITLNGAPGLVQERNGVPVMLLQAGDWRIEGVLHWSDEPDVLQVPREVGIVRLERESGEQAGTVRPDLGPDGRLRLSGKDEPDVEDRPEDSIQTRVFRLVQDDLPMQVTTLLRLDISGRARRILLEDALLPGSTPLAVQSPLPLQFAPEEGVYVQARPGRFDLRITSRMHGPVESIGPVAAPYGREFWAFAAHESLRVVEVQGVPGIDPQTTDMPQEWKRYPAYLVEPEASMVFKQMHRGAPGSMPDRLNISRTLMLDFDGQGLTVQDEIQGTVRNDWTLTMQPPGQLGRATLQGKDQPIVLLGKEERSGIELRKSQVQLTSESRYESFRGSLPATGWEREFDSVSARLQLPPGWQLLTASGADGVDASWVSRWSLLDIFLCLVIVLAVTRLRGFIPGAITLLFLTLAWQEPGAPRQVWLLLLAALALYRIFSDSQRLAQYRTGRRLALWLYGLAIVVMAWVAVPFVYQQVNQGLYPQLEPRPSLRVMPSTSGYGRGADQAVMQTNEMEVMEEAPAPRAMMRADSKGYASREKKAESLMYDPEALVQTGPGLPDWQWRSVNLSWSGPVAPDETLSLCLLSPTWNLWLSLARVVLLVLVLMYLVNLRAFALRSAEGLKTGVATAALLLPLCFMAAQPAAAEEAPGQAPQELQASAPPLPGPVPPPEPLPPRAPIPDVFPPQYLLHELQQRLLKPESCFPACLSSPQLRLQLDDALLRIEVEVHAAARILAPLPRVSDRWLPMRVLLDGELARDLYRDGKNLFIALEPGVQRVTLEGPAPRGLSFQVALPLASKQGQVQAPGWSVQGLSESGAIEGSLRLARNKADDAAKQAEEEKSQEGSYSIPPFLEVRRDVTLGLEWSVRTEVRRASPPGEAIHLSVPLLPGESVLSEEVRVIDGAAQIQLAPQQGQFQWESRLERSSEILLQAPKDVPWVETWQLSPANIWHLEITGIPETRLLGPGGAWQPTWRPWPGEKVQVAISRPQAAPGESMTIEKASLVQRVGSRLDENELTLSIRASKGARHVVMLPEAAELTGLTASGRDLPLVDGEPGAVEFPVSPGSQQVTVLWRQPREAGSSVQAPEVDLQHPAVNADVNITLPQDRWILLTWGGPVLGPAVKYWTYLLAAFVFAIGLGFLPWTPLKHWQWFLLAVGLSQLSPPAALCAVAWLPLLGLRREHYPREGWFGFNVLQLAMLALVAAGMLALYTAVELGLLGLPHMQVEGNSSYGNVLHWTQDRIAGPMPRPQVYSAPLWLFRVVMLAWSLWLAVSLLSWLRWGWEGFSQGGVLRSPKLRLSRQGGGKPWTRSSKAAESRDQQDKAAEETGGDDFRLEEEEKIDGSQS